ncbi:MAG TPA: accessory gene regulator B family protein [Pseudobacteroides sp.]|uniref:accessory gene regulator ArgB-like protein n=1 Tax=Pseudobacteroides sp. TaxID=1968840 RepID=UPI002F91DE4C
MIDKLSDIIASKIRENNRDITEEKAEIISYGANILIFQTIITAIIFLIAFLLGVVVYAAIAFAVIGLLRSTAGGAHSRTRTQCIITHLLSIFGTIILSSHIKYSSYIPSIVIFAASILMVLKYAPGETIDGPLYSDRKKRIQKITSCAFLITFFAICLFIKNLNLQIYYVIIISSLIPMMALSPAGYMVFGCKRR